MIAACPKCAARYRIERDKIGEAGVRLRCSRCESIFRVRAPAPAAASAPPPVEAVAPAPAAVKTAAPAPAPVETMAPAAPSAPVARPEARQPVQAQAPAPTQSEPLAPLSVLVAIPDVDLAKQTAQLLSDRGAPSIAVFDGVDAMMEIQRRIPKTVVLAADLPKMFGFQICEVLKRNESLKSIRVVLAGAVHHPDRYKREPTELYGADSYVETPDLPEALLPILVGWGLLEEEAPRQSPERLGSQNADPFGSADLGSAPEPGPLDAGMDLAADLGGPTAASPVPAPQAPAPAPLEASGSVHQSDLFDLGDSDSGSNDVSQPDGGMSFDFEEPAATPAAPAPVEPPRAPAEAAPAPAPEPTPAPAAAPTSEARAQAERLARIIVSDIVLYNEEKFSAAVVNGNVVSALSAELDEGRGLFASRVDAELRAETDFLAEELDRVARARGMK